MSAEPSRKRRKPVNIVDPLSNQLLQSADTDSITAPELIMNNSAEGVDDDGVRFLSNPENILTVSPEIITSILKNFSSRSLHVLSRVCRNWHFYSKQILRKRQCVRPFVVVIKRNTTRQTIDEVEEEQEFFKELDIDPRLIVLFGKLSLEQPCVGKRYFRNLRTLLPPQCCMVGGVNPAGVMGTDPKSGHIVDLQRQENDCLSCLVFPELQGVKIFTFRLTSDRLFELNENRMANNDQDIVGDDDFERLFNIPSDQRVKCLILLSPSFYEGKFIPEIFSLFYKRENGRIAMAWGSLRGTLVSPHAHHVQEIGLNGIAFCGDDSSMEALSFVIPSNVKSRTAIRQCLTDKIFDRGDSGNKPELDRTGKNRFQSTKPVETGTNRPWTVKSSFGFIFTSTCRGEGIFNGEAGVESGLIAERFPQTSFVGCFTLGECGVDFDCRNDRVDSKSELKVPDVMKSYSTVVAVVNIMS